MNDELRRRISDALDAPGGLEADGELSVLIASDADAAAYAADLVAISAALRGDELHGDEPQGHEPQGHEPQGHEPQGHEPQGHEPQGHDPRAKSEADWEALARSIEARLDDQAFAGGLDDLDVLAPPALGEVHPSSPPAEVVETPLPPEAAVARQREVLSAPPPAGEVVDLASRRSGPPAWVVWGGGLAAAAAATLGIVVGAATLSGAPTESAAAIVTADAEESDDALTAEPAVLEEPVAATQSTTAAAPERNELAVARPAPAPPAAELAEAPYDLEAPSRSAAGGGSSLPGSLGDAIGAFGQPAEPEPEPEEDGDDGGLAAVEAVLARLEPQMQRCIGAAGQIARVQVILAAGGRLVQVDVEAPFTGTPVGACLAERIRAVEFPPTTPQILRVPFRYQPAPRLGAGDDARGNAVQSRRRAVRRPAGSGARESSHDALGGLEGL